MTQLLEGTIPYREEDVKKYIDKGWWRGITLGDLLDRAADMHPDKEAFVDRTNRYTYGQAREKANKLALGLIRLGVQPLERVLIQLPNWNEFVFAYFACQKIGAIAVLLIDRYRPYEIDRLIDITGATAWIVPKNTHKINFVPIINDVLQDHPEVKNVITVRGQVDQPGFSCMENLIDDSQLTPENLELLAACNPDPMQVAHMGPTGGTTGAPKIVPRIHNSLVCGVESCSMSWGQHCEDINLIAGPIGHDLSFTKGFLGAVITQGKVIFQSELDNESICKCIEQEKVTSIIWVPTLAKRLVQYADLNSYNLSSLRKMHSAGGASHPDLVKEVIDRLDMKFFNGYGGTEGMTCITRNIDDYQTICCTVGRPTFPHDHYKVVDANGKELTTGQQGELLVKGPSVFSGYFSNPEENALVFDNEGYFKTGDLATINEKGYISLTGRIKEMINRGGESISSSEIEKLINRHPKVAVCAVIPMPDPLMGERACAYVEPKDEAVLTFEEIIAFLKDQKASVLQLPERIEFVNKMPVTATEKLNKKALRADIEKKLSEEAVA
ncbi:AMP-binding protein [Desulfopila aestuarii]|uniref:Mycobactin salicyl-AMP ligase n=1 Tax=Desulfopila aestuarii DSM 18488 TaxID=1121416 RepID=A0A1M7YIH7_9BACT|nr:AMP-binding protein [Desulfopila aestuarii]SHO52386.1 mycobactin salicyl-AMP ligase [Desulfopila aestuarii DSM 18488]